MNGTTAEDKNGVRERVWQLLADAKAARFPGARGRIPNFTGAEAAAERLASLPEWQAAGQIKANPDAPQLPVRTRALSEGKRVYMAVPRLTDERPFLLLDPDALSAPPRRAASIKGASREGQSVGVEEMPRVDLVVCGSVAVTREGQRVGKGGGFSDLELAVLTEAGLIDRETLLVSTVHPLQIVEEPLPETSHDFRVDRIVTSDEVVECPQAQRPPGIVWDHLDSAKIDAIPVLQKLARRRT